MAATPDARLLAQGKELFGLLDPTRQDALSSLLRKLRIADHDKYEVVATLASELSQYKTRGDLTLQQDNVYRVTFEGIPVHTSLETFAEIVRKIDPEVNIDVVLDSRMQQPLHTTQGEICRTTQRVVAALPITANIRAFVEGKSAVNDLPGTLYLRGDADRNLAFEIVMTPELKERIKMLEILAWNKHQIESAIRENVEKCLKMASFPDSAVTVRFNTVRKVNRTLSIFPCSEGKIMLCLPSRDCMSLMSRTLPCLRLEEVGPLPAVVLEIVLWATTSYSLETSDIRAATKLRLAQSHMQGFRPVPKALFQVSCQVDVQLQEKHRNLLSKSVGPIEESLQVALGGVNSGIVGVQIGSDENGRPLLNKATILISDLTEDDPRISNTLMRRLQEGSAAIHTEVARSIKARGPITRTLIKEPEPTPYTAATIATTIMKQFMMDPGMQLAIPARMTSGDSLPLAEGDGQQHEIAASDLGPLISETYIDLRRLLQDRTQEPTVRQIACALRQLEAQGGISVYGDVIQTVEVFVIHPTLSDSWADGSAMDSA